MSGSVEKNLEMKSPQGQDKDAWVKMQQKTFTKWVNNNLRKKGYAPIQDVQTEFETGTKLMEIINALYALPIPKHNKAPKLRPHKLDNIELALRMVENDAKIKTNFLKPIHLVDHDLKMLLGMLWSIILDYAIKGISVDDLNAKEGLLLWCRKKTAGYKHIDPPGIQNFSGNWRNGLAFCALIHRHQPQMLDYASLDPKNAKENLELAFSVAEKLGIPRLLDVEDCMAERPDDKAIMTQVAEYFHRFASQDVKELHARRVRKFVTYAQRIHKMKKEYEDRAKALLAWVDKKKVSLQGTQFGDSLDQVMSVFESFKQFLVSEKPPKSAEKLDLEDLFAELQTELKVNDRPPYNPPPQFSPENIENAWNGLYEAEKVHAKSVREHRFKFVRKEEAKLSEDKLKEFKDAFNHFDVDHDNTLSKTEFKAAAAANSVVFKDDDGFDKVYDRVSQGKGSISLEQFTQYLRALQEDRDSPDQLKEAFQNLAGDSVTISAEQLNVPPLSAEDTDFLVHEMPKKGDNQYDYNAFVTAAFLSHA